MFVVESYDLDTSFEYGLRGATPHKLVPTRMVVRASNVRVTPERRRVPVTLAALPFGLLCSIELACVDGSGSATAFPAPFIVHVTKATGSRDSARVSPSTPSSVSLTSGALCVDQDAVDADLRAVLRDTGHMMAFRAVAAGSIAYIELEFPDIGFDVPPEFMLIYRGANTLPMKTDTVSAFRRGSGVAFGFPPLLPAQRRAGINARMGGLARQEV
jgi:uncharacterized membrane protein (UPF0136 family)